MACQVSAAWHAGKDVAPLVLVEGAVLGGGAFSRVSIVTGAAGVPVSPVPTKHAFLATHE